MAYVLDFSLALGTSKTGLTLAAQLVDTAGADVGAEVTSGFTEIGQGYYLWHYASIPDAHRGGVKFYESSVPGTILAFAAINPQEAERIDVASSSLATAAALATVDSNVDAILADTGTDGVVVASHTTAAKAELQAEAQDAIEANDLDHLIQVTAGNEEPTDGSYLDQVMHKAAGQGFDATSDSLEAIRDAIRSLPQTTAAAARLSDAGTLAPIAYTTYSETISGTYTSGKTASKVTMTIKKSYDDPDASAVLQADSDGGLTVLNGATYSTTGDATIAFDQTAGTVTPTISDAAMVLIGMRSDLVYDIKIHYSDGESSRFAYGKFTIDNTATRAVT